MDTAAMKIPVSPWRCYSRHHQGPGHACQTSWCAGVRLQLRVPQVQGELGDQQGISRSSAELTVMRMRSQP